MKHMFTKPARVWVLAEGAAAPRQLPEEELETVFEKYEDTGFEPKLHWLYETISCDTIDVRDLPGLGHLWFDDVGRLAERPGNPVASALYEYCYRFGESILGTAVLVVYPDVPGRADKSTIEEAFRLISEARARMN